MWEVLRNAFTTVHGRLELMLTERRRPYFWVLVRSAVSRVRREELQRNVVGIPEGQHISITRIDNSPVLNS